MSTDPVADALAEADHAAAETRYRLQLAGEMYQAGWRGGYQAAQQEAAEEDARQWAQFTRHLANTPAHAELEERRWGPGGRAAHIADPRPGHFPGRGAPPQPHGPEPEIEASA
ncbi:MAG: hypothetical protein ACRDPY_21180 [Streptosporangiaceae bacterium]